VQRVIDTMAHARLFATDARLARCLAALFNTLHDPESSLD
jgi:hypothetical protein